MSGKVLRIGRSGVRALQRADLDFALQLCAKEPVNSVLAAARLLELRAARTNYLESWGWPRSGPLQALCLTGANFVPVLDPDLSPELARRALSAFAVHAIRTRNRSSSLVGPSAAVLEIWRQLSRVRRARDVRASQPSMIMDADSQVAHNTAVRTLGPADFDTLFPASVAMFTEEVGYSPLTHDGGASYAARVRYLLAAGRSYAHTALDQDGKPEIIFKADVGALTPHVAQIQGVWVAPSHRGRGLATSSMAAVVYRVLRQHAPIVSLYVNDYNAAAVATYDRVGFRRVGEYATVLF